MREKNEQDHLGIVAATNRETVRLTDGRHGRIVWWSEKGDYATILIGGRHVRVAKSDVKLPS